MAAIPRRSRRPRRPEFVIVDGAPGLEAALVALWGDDLPIQRCTVHKHRNLLAQITMRKVDGWQTLDKPIEPMTLDLAA